MPETIKRAKGADFLFSITDPQTVFTTEDFSEEQVMIQNTLIGFVKNVHQPLAEEMEKGVHEHNITLLKSLGELGMLGTHMPEKYGGLELDTKTNAIISEEIGKTGAFSTSFGAHTGIGMLPILYYGTEEQKQKYLPQLIRGDKISCYCLTEPGSGSDALAAKTNAVLTEDGKYYVLNGQKMWISNAGFADIFIVFAKIEGKEFTGFIVEKEMQGLSLGEEEKKMGIKGSSTRQVFFENVKVPIENLLGEPGKGHLIAFNVLNTGRFKIGPSALGGMKGLIDLSVRYSNERMQFGKRISEFGAIQSKLASQASMCFACDAATYRTSGLIEEEIVNHKALGMDYSDAKREAAEEFALESSILKVGVTDMLNIVASECVQIYGGMGFSEEAPAARAFRDSRISMIYEGTNEINRLLMLNLIFRRALKGELDLLTPATAVQRELEVAHLTDNLLTADDGQEVLKNLKKIPAMLLGQLGKLAMSAKLDLKNEQEILLNLADILIQIYMAESAWLRFLKHPNSELAGSDVRKAAVQLFMFEAVELIRKKSREAVSSFVLPGKQDKFFEAIDKFSQYNAPNVRDLKRILAGHLIARNRYSL